MAKTPKTEKRARPAATTRRASKPTKVTVKTEATPVKTETRASKPAAATRTTTKDEIVEREDPATFSPQRRKAIYDGLLSLDVSPERANAFIDHLKSWELRPIKFVAYDEGLYEALQRAAR